MSIAFRLCGRASWFQEELTLRALLAEVKHGANFEDLIAALAVNLGLAAEAPGRYKVSMGTVEAVHALFGTGCLLSKVSHLNKTSF